jgi:hypothetical protein
MVWVLSLSYYFLDSRLKRYLLPMSKVMAGKEYYPIPSLLDGSRYFLAAAA